MNKEHWLAERRKGIGGSDAAAALGLSQYKTPYQLYLDKIGETPDQEDNEAMLWGRALEPVIRQQYAERTGRTVLMPKSILRHDKHNFMLANIDGYTDGGRLLEIKTTRTAKGWGEPDTDEIPDIYGMQIQHYLIVTGLVVADVAVLIGGSDYRQYVVEADKELQELIIEGEADFWRHVENREPPEPVSYSDVVARYGRHSEAREIEADDDVLGDLGGLHNVRREIKELQKTEESFKTSIMKAMGDADTLTYRGERLVTWKASKGASRFDATAFKKAHPDLYAQFTKTSDPSRRFLIK